jgi:hypothetical protein
VDWRQQQPRGEWAAGACVCVCVRDRSHCCRDAATDHACTCRDLLSRFTSWEGAEGRSGQMLQMLAWKIINQHH